MGRCLEIVLTDLGEMIGTGLYTSLTYEEKNNVQVCRKKGMSVLMEAAFGKIGYISFICGFKRLSRPIV